MIEIVAVTAGPWREPWGPELYREGWQVWGCDGRREPQTAFHERSSYEDERFDEVWWMPLA